LKKIQVFGTALKSSKVCVVFKGERAIAALRPGSDFQKLKELVAKYWKVTICRGDVAQVR
jgi:hypothetical protein